MPYVISGSIDATRMVKREYSQEQFWNFYAPLLRGEELTPELLAQKPDPYIVKAPEKGGMPEVFGEWTIKDSVRQIIEDLEPGVHTFIPVNLRVRGSDKDWGQYFFLYPGQVIDAIVIDETDFVEGRGRAGFGKLVLDGMRSYTLSPFGDTVLDGRLIEGRQLWRGGRGKMGGGGDHFFNYLFCSDELAARIEQAGIEGWRFRRCKLKRDS
jgi:uncharacterized protein DUF1629